MTDTVLDFVSLLRSDDDASTKANRILRRYKKTGAVMSKDNTSNDAAQAVSPACGSRPPCAQVCQDPRLKLAELRRAEDFDKMASDAEH